MATHALHTLSDFLEPVNRDEFAKENYNDLQFGRKITFCENNLSEAEQADLVLIGCGDTRGEGIPLPKISAPDAVRNEFYSLYHWHTEIDIADAGNIKTGASPDDTYAALRSVIAELLQLDKRVVILGGSHNLSLAQYQAYAYQKKIIEAACVDARIDLNADDALPADNFLMQLFTEEPAFLSHYNHIAFQSYLIHPQMLETIDKLGFDCYRVGRVKEDIEEMEPVIRNAELFSFDITAIQNSAAPANFLPNGLNGEEACSLMQYAGMSPKISTAGIYGFLPQNDVHNLTAKQLSQMLWYFIDGMQKGKHETALSERANFNEYKMAFAEVETHFLQSKKTGRWWMQTPDKKYIACSYKDYVTASQNEIPERWIRAVERGL